MGYFKHNHPPEPQLSPPAGVRLWEAGPDEWWIAWERPLLNVEAVALLHGHDPATLCELARQDYSAQRSMRWRIPTEAQGFVALAWVRRNTLGPASVALPLRPPVPAEPPPPLAPMPVTPIAPPAPPMPVTPIAPPAPPPVAPVLPVTPPPTEFACVCCTPPQPLQRGAGVLQCPRSGESYAILANGERIRVSELPFGLCRCCEARQPLIRSGAQIVCYANPSQAYRAEQGRYVPVVSVESDAVVLSDAEAIDAALRANSALLGVNGVFVPPRQRGR